MFQIDQFSDGNRFLNLVMGSTDGQSIPQRPAVDKLPNYATFIKFKVSIFFSSFLFYVCGFQKCEQKILSVGELIGMSDQPISMVQ